MQMPNSIYATEPASDVSKKYQFISTHQILKTFAEQGWEPVAANQARVRKQTHYGFQKHVVRLRQSGSNPLLSENMPEIVLVNSHNRGSSVQIMAGIFRMVCSNGLIVADSVFESRKIRHVGYAVDHVLEAITAVESSLEFIMGRITTLKAIPMTADDALRFASEACLLRWEEGKAPNPRALLKLHRMGDNLDTLWNVLNVVQENMLRGYRARRSWGSRINVGIRGVTGITQNVSLNKGLWKMAEEFAKGEPVKEVLVPA